MRAFVMTVARCAAMELFHLLTFNGCSRWLWAWRICRAIEGPEFPERHEG